jgi:hypothetical protein
MERYAQSEIDRAYGQTARQHRPTEMSASPPGPGWDVLPFELPCSGCGADLAGQQEAQCPECGLEFDWDDVLPADRLRCLHCGYQLSGLTVPRCPECGEPFEWPEVLAAARSRSSDLFENQWRRSRFGLALLRTWLLAAFRPRKLWSLYDVHDPPRVVPLLLFAGLQCLLFARGWHLLALAADSSMNWLCQVFEPRMRFSYNFWPARDFLPFMGLWLLMGFVSLQVFVQSKRQYHVDWRHILRVYVHATAFGSLLLPVWLLAEWAIDLTLFLIPAIRPVSQLVYLRVGDVLFVLGVLMTWTQLWIGYRRYLKIPRGWGIAALALVLGHALARLVQIYV